MSNDNLNLPDRQQYPLLALALDGGNHFTRGIYLNGLSMWDVNDVPVDMVMKEPLISELRHAEAHCRLVIDKSGELLGFRDDFPGDSDE